MEIRNKTVDDSDTVNGSGSSMLSCEWCIDWQVVPLPRYTSHIVSRYIKVSWMSTV